MTGFSVTAEAIDGGTMAVSVFISFDPGPMRAFRPYLTVELDEAHATELLGTTALAVERMRRLREGGE